MKTPALFWIVLIALTLGVSSAFFFMAGGPENGKAASPGPASSQASGGVSLANAPEAAPAFSPSIPSSPGPSSPIAPQDKPQILSAIEEAAVSYSAEELPKIQPYLTHADPEVRAAALQGMITLGDAAAAPMLRAAAQLALSPEEATAMREAASYVELPSGSLLQKGPRAAR